MYTVSSMLHMSRYLFCYWFSFLFHGSPRTKALERGQAITTIFEAYTTLRVDLLNHTYARMDKLLQSTN